MPPSTSVSSFPLVATIGDPDGTRTVTSIIALLVAIGIALLLVAFWMYRTTRPDPELLAPLEVMGERTWRRADPVWQRRRLDELRPRGARPLAPSAAPPVVDEAFEAGPAAAGFDDLHQPDGSGDHAQPARSGGYTPTELARPAIDELPEGEFDAEALAEAEAELDRELADRAERTAHDRMGWHSTG